MNDIYSVNNIGFNSFSSAVAYAKSISAEVFQIDNGARRWAPIPKSTKKTVRHMLVLADGSTRELGKVRR